MIVECGHCGAPLDTSKQNERLLTKCNYCGVENRRDVLRQMLEIDVTTFRAPKKWTPPAHVAAKSEELKYKGGGKGVAIFILLMTLGPLLIPLGIGFMSVVWPHFHGLTPQVLISQPLDRTADQLASQLPSTTHNGNYVRSQFQVGTALTYKEVTFTWKEESPTFVNNFTLRNEDKGKLDPAILKRFATGLHGGVSKDGNWRWGGVSVSVDLKDGDISVYVNPKVEDHPNVFRKRQLDAVQQVVLSAVFGLTSKVPQTELIEVLGYGYPTAVIATFDPTTPIESSKAAVLRSFPGAIARSVTEYIVPIDHPLFMSFRLNWSNSANGKLKSLHFDELEAFLTQRSSFVACLTTQLGAPKENVTDYAKSKKSYEFLINPSNTLGQGGELEIGETSVYFNPRRDVIERDTWARLFAALGKCRG